MKYFTNELWIQINSNLIEEREKAEKEWSLASELYNFEFEKIKNEIPKRSYIVYMNNYGFHDFSLEKIEIEQQNQTESECVRIRLLVSDLYSGKYEIVYSGVTKFNIQFDRTDSHLSKRPYNDTWGYDELFKIGDKLYSHEILFLSGGTILTHFKNIKITKCK